MFWKLTPKIFTFIFTLLTAVGVTSQLNAEQMIQKDPKDLIKKMVEVVGSMEDLIALKDVEYIYTYGNSLNGKQDISKERYIFEGELSWGKYLRHKGLIFPDQEGEVIQGYNGKSAWTTFDGKLVDDPEAVKMAEFVRKTNFYWFAMMPKLLDPGVHYEYKGIRKVNGLEYELVEITFGENVGDVADIYVLYINSRTHLVDQFLFTVMDWGMKEPMLMKVKYEEINGLKLPTKRMFTPANWEGEIREKIWTDQIITDIKFNNGFLRSDFDKYVL